jgi:hypothetical protein
MCLSLIYFPKYVPPRFISNNIWCETLGLVEWCKDYMCREKKQTFFSCQRFWKKPDKTQVFPEDKTRSLLQLLLADNIVSVYTAICW